MPNVLSPRDLVSRPDNMDETVLSSSHRSCQDNVYTKFGPFCQFVLKTLSKNQNLTSIKGRKPFANL